MYCLSSKQKARRPKVKISKPIKFSQNKQIEDKMGPGDLISAHQFDYGTSHGLLKEVRNEEAENCYHCGTLYTDGASGLIHIEPEVSLGAGETIIDKQCVEQRIWHLGGVLSNHYHYDNGNLMLHCSEKIVPRNINHKFCPVLEHSTRMPMLNMTSKQFYIGHEL